MKSGTITGLLGAALMAGSGLGASAEITANPYQIIIDRNPFALKPIPPPPPPVSPTNDVVQTPAPDIKLTGITTLLGTARVFLQLEDKQTKKTDYAPPLSEGESYKDLVVLAIDPDNGKVRVKNGDAESTLDFKNNGVKPATVAAAPAIPGVPLNTGMVPPPPGSGAAAAVATPQANNFGRGAIVSGGATAAAIPNAPVVNGLPSRPVRTDAAVNPGVNSMAILGGGQGGNIYNANPTPQPTATPPPMSRDEAEARIEATRRILEANNDSRSRLMPPTGLGRMLNPGANNGGVPPPAPAPVR